MVSQDQTTFQADPTSILSPNQPPPPHRKASADEKAIRRARTDPGRHWLSPGGIPHWMSSIFHSFRNITTFGYVVETPSEGDRLTKRQSTHWSFLGSSWCCMESTPTRRKIDAGSVTRIQGLFLSLLSHRCINRIIFFVWVIYVEYWRFVITCPETGLFSSKAMIFFIDKWNIWMYQPTQCVLKNIRIILFNNLCPF